MEYLHGSLEARQWRVKDHLIMTSLWFCDVSQLNNCTAIEEHLQKDSKRFKENGRAQNDAFKAI